MPTDTSETGLESLIVASLVNEAGYVQGKSADYDREYAVDLTQLIHFLSATQPKTLANLGLEQDDPKRKRFLRRKRCCRGWKRSFVCGTTMTIMQTQVESTESGHNVGIQTKS